MLDGKDILIKARTGSGKTGAFTIPVIQKILRNKSSQKHQEIKCIILAPSKELCKQIGGVLSSLTSKCSREVKCLDVSAQVELSVQKPLLSEQPDIVIGTPSRILQHFKAGNMNVKQTLDTLIIDEADLVRSTSKQQNV